MARKTNSRPNRVAMYARVSTLDKGQTTQNQLRQLREYAKRRKWSDVTVFEEKKSGALGEAERPQLAAMMEQVRRMQFDIVLVWSFDRFARSLRQLINAMEEMQALGVEFVSYHEQIDTTTPMGEAMFAITGALAQLERRLIQERSKAGYERALEEGKLCHRPRRVFDHHKMLHLFAHGTNGDEIAKQIGVSRATMSRRLTDKIREIQQRLKLDSDAGYYTLSNFDEKKLETVGRDFDLQSHELRQVLLYGRRRFERKPRK